MGSNQWNVDQCAPQPTYLIVEQIHHKSGMPAFGNTIGPSVYQVYRRVLQVCDLQDFYFEGRRIAGAPSKWQYIQEFLTPGKQISLRSTGEKGFKVAYSGFSSLLTPLPKVGGFLPESWTKEYNIGAPLSPFVYGTDPVPRIQLYGNPNAIFEMPGDSPPPTAIGVYSIGGRLEFPPPAERERIMRQLVQRIPAANR